MNADQENDNGQSGELQLDVVTCPLCDCDQARPFVSGEDYRYGVEGEFSLVKCNGCRLVFMNPQPIESSIGLCYPASYAPHQKEDHGTEVAQRNSETPAPADSSHKPWYLSGFARSLPGLKRFYYWLAEDHSNLIPRLNKTQPKALELGCAHGEFLSRLQENGWDVEGVELGAEAAQRARQRGLDVQTSNLESANLDGKTFDAVFAWMVIEHLPNPRKTLTSIHDIMEPDGQFLFSVPNLRCWEPWIFGRYWDAYDFPRHLQHFTPATVRQMLKECGFEKVRIVHQHNLLNVVSSVGIFLKYRLGFKKSGQRLLDYSDNPTMWPQLLMAPFAKVLGWIRQGGRLTIIASRGSDVESHV